MRIFRLYTLFFFLSCSIVTFSVNLPTFPYYGVNDLYAINQDNIEMSAGTRISNINLQIQTVSSGWGDVCLAKGEQGACQDCCKELLLETKQIDGSYNAGDVILYSTCLKDCGGGQSLPLDSTLWLLPFAITYAGIKIRKSAN